MRNSKRLQAVRATLPAQRFSQVMDELFDLLPGAAVPRGSRTKLRLLDSRVIAAVASYRDAVRLCWGARSRRTMSLRQLAEETGAYASHVCDYISADETKRELPAKRIDAFEVSCGNRGISQWLAHRAGLPISYASNARRARNAK